MIIAVAPLEAAAEMRTGGVIRRTVKYRVQSDDQYEDPERVLAAPFVPVASWNLTTIPNVFMTTYSWGDATDINAPTKPGGAKVHTDQSVYLIAARARVERPIDTPGGHPYYWIVEGEYFDPPSSQMAFETALSDEGRWATQ